MLSLDVWNTFDKIEANYLLLGQALGASPQAEDIVREMRAKLDNTRQATLGRTQPTVLVLSPVGPGTGPYWIGASNISFDIVRQAGAVNVAEAWGVTRSVKASMEQVLKADPDFLVLLQWKQGDNADLDEITSSPGWSSLRAVKDHKVKIMTVKQMLYPNRYNADAVEELAQWFHPQLDFP